jgi:predicted hydrocarbon binding protein
MKMNRKEFIARSFKVVLGAGAAIFLNKPNRASSFSTANFQEGEMPQKQKFLHDWLSNLMKNMDSQLDEESKIKVLEECGRACAQRHAKAEALKSKGNLDGWLETMKKWVGANNVQKEGNSVRIVYSKCFCPLVSDLEPLLTETFCNCSRGWLKENFETVVGKTVEAKLDDSIMMGGKECRFTVLIP